MIFAAAVFIGIAGVFYMFSFSKNNNTDAVLLLEEEDSPSKLQEGNTQEETESEKVKQQMEGIEPSEEIYVHVCGQVTKPGVYKLTVGARICDAIKAAKGMKKTAAKNFVNQAQRLTDGEQIYIPSKKEVKVEENLVASIQNETTQDRSDAGKININTATLEELMTLSGIGESKAKSIMAYRKEHGNFKSIEEIKNIQGIKDGVFNKIKENIIV